MGITPPLSDCCRGLSSKDMLSSARSLEGTRRPPGEDRFHSHRSNNRDPAGASARSQRGTPQRHLCAWTDLARKNPRAASPQPLNIGLSAMATSADGAAITQCELPPVASCKDG